MRTIHFVVLGFLAAVAAPHLVAQESGPLRGKDVGKEATAKKKTDKPAIEGTFQLGAKTYKLQHGLAFRNKSGDELTTVVHLTEKAFPAEALKSLMQSLRNSGNDEDFFVFEPFFRITVTVDSDSQTFVNVMLPNGSGFNISEHKSNAQISGDRVQGRAFVPEPQEVFEKRYRCDVKFDVRLLSVGG